MTLENAFESFFIALVFISLKFKNFNIIVCDSFFSFKKSLINYMQKEKQIYRFKSLDNSKHGQK